jgi:hypothetical protein
LYIFLFCLGCASGARKIQTKEFNLEFINYRSSEKGRFFLSLIDWDHFSQIPSISELIILNSSGHIDFDRRFSANYVANVTDFKPLEKDVYSYLVSLDQTNGCKMKAQFLSSDGSELLQSVTKKLGEDLDCHDVILSPKGNYIFMFTRKSPADEYVQPEISEYTKSGDLVFTWRLMDHFKIPSDRTFEDSDPAHMSSISFTEDGYMLVSLRGLSEILKVNYSTGAVIDTISAKSWIFKNDTLGGFRGQHDVQALSGDRIILFDNGVVRTKSDRPSRAVEYKLDYKAKTATLIWEFRADFQNYQREACGSVQRLDNGNTLIGWGLAGNLAMGASNRYPIFTEVTTSGEKVRELVSPQNLVGYRVYFSK